MNNERVQNLSAIMESTSLLLLGLDHKCGMTRHLQDSCFMMEGPTQKAQNENVFLRMRQGHKCKYLIVRNHFLGGK